MVRLNRGIIMGRHVLTTQLGNRELTRPAVIISGLIGFVLILVLTHRFGVGLSPDSLAYLNATKSLLAGDGFLDVGGRPFTGWPPLFPMLMAAPDFLGIDAITASRFLNAAAFGATVFMAGLLFSDYLKSKVLVVLGTMSILASPPLGQVSVKVWSEPLFVLFAVLFVYFLGKFLGERKFEYLILIASFAALGCLQRYLGITLIITGFISIAFVVREISLAQRSKYLTVFSLIATVPVGIWLTRNYIVAGYFVGDHSEVYRTVAQSAGDMVEVLTSWFVPPQIPFTPALIIICAAVSLLIALVVGLQYKLDRRVNFQLVGLWPAGCFLVIYALMLIPVTTRLTPIDYRYMAPVYVFVMLLLFVGVEAAASQLNRIGRGKWLGNGMVTGLCALWLMNLAAYAISFDWREQLCTVVDETGCGLLLIGT